MRMFVWLTACVLLVACSSGGDTESADTAADQAEVVEVVEVTTVELATYHVACGCSVDGVGDCGNYIEIDSEYVVISNGEVVGLGEMEWCGKSDVQVEASGTLEDGEFVAATLVVQ